MPVPVAMHDYAKNADMQRIAMLEALSNCPTTLRHLGPDATMTIVDYGASDGVNS